MTEFAYDPSSDADQALRIIAQLAYTMPDGDSPAACCPLVEHLGGEQVVQELLNNRMVRELTDEDPGDGKRVGMTDSGLRFLDAKVNSEEYVINCDDTWEGEWNDLSAPTGGEQL